MLNPDQNVSVVDNNEGIIKPADNVSSITTTPSAVT